MAAAAQVTIERSTIINMIAYHREMASQLEKKLQVQEKASVSTQGSRKGRSAKAEAAATQVGMTFRKSLIKTQCKK